MPTILLGNGNCPILPNTIYYYNVKLLDNCPVGWPCTFKILEPGAMQGTSGTHPACTSGSGSGSGTTSGSGTSSGTGTTGIPAFPWTIHGATYTSLSAVQTAFSPSCVNVNGVRVLSGFGPCVSGTAP
ncbi:MAG: hypothetical protein WAT84_03895 [Candidatus Moraniibacteriota bacterium]